MSGTINSPEYTVYVKHEGTRYRITNAVVSLTLSEKESTIAQAVNIELRQIRVGDGYITGIARRLDRIYVYADTGNGSKEVFRGYIWETRYAKSASGRELTLICYDNLIYLQESEESQFIKKGQSTKAIFETLCKKKGIKLDYTYLSIKNEKMLIKGKLSDVFLDDLLEPVRKKKGVRGVIRYEKGTMHVRKEGSNKTVYNFKHGSTEETGNIITTTHTVSMDGICTKILILGSQKDNAQTPVRATIEGKTKLYGTVQKLVSGSDNDKLSELKEEANQYLKDYGHPQVEVNLQAVDNPWVHKGSKIYIDDGYKSGYAIVYDISHDAAKKIMEIDARWEEK